MSLSAYQTLIADLGSSIGAPGMAAGNDGYVGLQIDGRDLHIQYEPEDDIVVLFARLQEVDPDRRDAIYSMLLAANLFWQGTRGATFSADFYTGRIFLADRRNLEDLNLESLSIWIERFANGVTYWWNRLDSANDGGPLSDDDDGGKPPSDGGGGSTPGGGIPLPWGMPAGGMFA